MNTYKMDTFMEQIVVRRSTPLDLIKRLGIILAAMICIFLFLFILPALPNTIGQLFSMLGIVFALVILYGAYYLIGGTSIEYEYIMTGGELDIDKIIAKKRRRRIISINGTAFTQVAHYHTGVNLKGLTKIMACSSLTDDHTYYAQFEHPTHGKGVLLFTPNDQILQELRRRTKRMIWK